MDFKKNFFKYILILLFLFLLINSFYRFIIKHDYLISYEGECDPYSQSCFSTCADDECSEIIYSSLIIRNASNVLPLCGNNIIECEIANECLSSEEDCSISYCDQNNKNAQCENLEELDRPKEEIIPTDLESDTINESDIDNNKVE